MPYVNVQITPGVSRAQKQALVAEITGALVRGLGKSPEHIHVVIQEIAEEDWGFAGLLTDDWRHAQGQHPTGTRLGHPCGTPANSACRIVAPTPASSTPVAERRPAAQHDL